MLATAFCSFLSVAGNNAPASECASTIIIFVVFLYQLHIIIVELPLMIVFTLSRTEKCW